jgi:hypothetical protein
MEHHAADERAVSVNDPDGFALSEAMLTNLRNEVSDKLCNRLVMPIEQPQTTTPPVW